MRALTLWQPWATALVLGIKGPETRGNPPAGDWPHVPERMSCPECGGTGCADCEVGEPHSCPFVDSPNLAEHLRAVGHDDVLCTTCHGDRTIKQRRMSGYAIEPGETVAVHAAQRFPKTVPGLGRPMVGGLPDGPQHLDWLLDRPIREADDPTGEGGDLYAFPIPLGVIVGTIRVTEVLPIVERTWPFDVTDALASLPPDHPYYPQLHEWRDGKFVGERPEWRPWGDYTPGRWAWLVADPTEFDEPIPAVGHRGIWEWDQ
jgi:hypothetical protein